MASVINPIKRDFPFIDLLKPESEPLVAVLLALEPRLRWKIPEVIRSQKGSRVEL